MQLSSAEVVQKCGTSALHGKLVCSPSKAPYSVQQTKPVLKSPSSPELLSPQAPSKTKTLSFSSVEACNVFNSQVRRNGFSVAASASFSAYGFGVSAAHSQGSSKEHSQASGSSKQSSCIVVMNYTWIPLARFRHPTDRMELSGEALDSLEHLHTRHHAQAFLSDFGSHLNAGYHVLGGAYVDRLTVETTAAEEWSTLTRLASQQMETSAAAGGWGATVGIKAVKYGGDESQSQDVRTKRTATVRFEQDVWGPAGTSSKEEFIQRLKEERGTWCLLDTDGVSAVLEPVWDVVRRHAARLPDGSAQREQLHAAAGCLEQEWQAMVARDISREVPEVVDAYRRSALRGADAAQRPARTVTAAEALAAITAHLKDCQLHDMALLRRRGDLLVTAFQVMLHAAHQQSVRYGMDLLPQLLSQPFTLELLEALAVQAALQDSLRQLVQVVLTPDVMSRLRVELPPNVKELLSAAGGRAAAGPLPVRRPAPVPELRNLPQHLSDMMEEGMGRPEEERNEAIGHTLARVLAQRAADPLRGQVQVLLREYGLTDTGGWLRQPSAQYLAALIDSLAACVSPNQQPPPAQQPSSASGSARQQLPSLHQFRVESPQGPYQRTLSFRHYAAGTDAVPAELNLTPLEQTLHACLRHHQTMPLHLGAPPASSRRQRKVKQAAGPRGAPPVPSGPSNLQVLLSLWDKSDLAGRMEGAERLLRVRQMVPLMTPLPDGRTHYHVEALRFLELGADNGSVRPYDDTLLPRVVFYTAPGCNADCTREVMNKVVGCEAVAGDRGASIGPLVEMGYGAIRIRGSPARHCLVFLVSGDAAAALPFLSEGAELVIVHGPEEAAEELLRGHASASRNFAGFLSDGASDFEDVLLTDDDAGPTWMSGAQRDIEAALRDDAERYTRAPDPKPKLCNTFRLPDGVVADELQGVEAIGDFLRSLSSSAIHSDSRKLQRLLADIAELDFAILRRRGTPAGDLQGVKVALQAEMQRHAQPGLMAPVVALLVQIMTKVTDGASRTVAIMELVRCLQACTAPQMDDLLRASRAAQETWLKRKDKRSQQEHLAAKLRYTDQAVGLEHLLREMCHMYCCANDRRANELPALAAQHLLDGFPLELLDGDAGAISPDWIKAVFDCLASRVRVPVDGAMAHPGRRTRPARILSMAAVGAQSSGKSTLLNAQFGARFRTGAGMCTRGMHMLLVPYVHADAGFDYLLLLDTQGLDSPEHSLAADSQVKDRRLATLAVLASDATQFTIWGEGKQTLQNILPLVLLARKSVCHLPGYPCELLLAVNAFDVSQAFKVEAQNMALQEFFNDCANNLRKTDFPGVRQVPEGHAGGSSSGADEEQEPIERFSITQDPSDPSSDLVFLGFCTSGEGADSKVNDQYAVRAGRLWERVLAKVKAANGGNDWRGVELRVWAQRVQEVWQYSVLKADHELSFASLVKYNQHRCLEQELDALKSAFFRACHSSWQEMDARLTAAATEKMGHANLLEEAEAVAERKQRQYRESLAPCWRALNTGLDELAEKPQYRVWMQERRGQVSASCRQEQELHVRLLHNAISEAYCFHAVAEQSEARIKEAICEWADTKLNGAEREAGFNALFEAELEHARKRDEKAAPMADRVSAEVFYIYNDACGYQVDRSIYLPAGAPGMAGASGSGIVGRVVGKAKQFVQALPFLPGAGSNEEYLLVEASIAVHNAMQGVRCFSANVVTEVAVKVQELLAGTRNKDTICKVHTAVAIHLRQALEAKQRKWDDQHNIVSRLKAKRRDFKEFFDACVSGERGVRLLAFELKTVFDGYTEVFVASSAVIMATGVDRGIAEYNAPHKVLSRQPWAKQYKALEVEVDLHLFGMAQQAARWRDGFTMEWLLAAVEAPAQHHEEVVLGLIRDLVTPEVVAELWEIFRSATTTALQLAVAAPCNQGGDAPRTRTFLKALAQAGGLPADSTAAASSLLPAGFASNVSNLLATLAPRYADTDRIMNFQEVVDQVMSEVVAKKWRCPEAREVQAPLADAVLRHLREHVRENSAMLPRCQAVCRLCGMPCEKECKHDGRHDCNHQVQGLSGTRMVDTITDRVLHLSCTTCTQAVRDKNCFRWPAGSKNWLPYQDFGKVFDTWNTPSEFTRNYVREYVFVKFHKEMAERFKVPQAAEGDLHKLHAMEATALQQKLEERRVDFVGS